MNGSEEGYDEELGLSHRSEVWRSLKLYYTPFSDNPPYDKSNKPNPEQVKQRVIEALRGLDEEDYESFCDIARLCIDRNRSFLRSSGFGNDVKEDLIDLGVISDLPWLEKIIVENVDHAFIINPGADATFYTGLAFVALGYIAGAVGAGNLTDELVQNEHVAYAASAVGSVLGAIGGGILTYLLYKPLNFFMERSREKQMQKAKEIFVEKVKEYIAGE